MTVAGRKIFFFDRALNLPIIPDFEGPGELFFRPQDTRVSESGNGALPVLVNQVTRLGAWTRIEGSIAGLDRTIELNLNGQHVPGPGHRVMVEVRRASLYPFQTKGAANGAQPQRQPLEDLLECAS